MTKKEIKSKFDEIVDFSGCAMYIDTPLKRYSSGMRVRLGFAVAAFLEPEVLIVDEVLAVGDAEFTQKAIGKMQDISKSEGRTVLFVSHNMAAIKALCTRALLMENGMISAQGTPDEMVQKYLEINSSEYRLEAIHPEIDLNSHRKHNVIFLKSAKISTSQLIITDSFYVEFEFILNDKMQTQLTVSLDILNFEDQIIFGSAQKFETKNQEIFFSRCIVPSNILNDIPYYINFYVLDRKMKTVFSISRILSFKMEEGLREELFFGQVNGFVRPKLRWEINQ